MDAIAKSIDDKEELVQKVRENKDKYDNMTEEQMNILMDCKKKEDFHKNIVKTLKQDKDVILKKQKEKHLDVSKLKQK